MSKEKVLTRNGHSMFEISSMVQKSIRRHDVELALYSCMEMKDKYRGYLWKRLLVVSAEDCYDLTTGKVIALRNADIACKNDELFFKAALHLLNARKNRDADFFACNMINSRDVIQIEDSANPCIGEENCKTKNGHFYLDVVNAMKQAINDNDVVKTGYCACELLRYRKILWKTLVSVATSFGFANVTQEIIALKQADESQSGDVITWSVIFICKACTTLLKVGKYKTDKIFEDVSELRLNVMPDLNKFHIIPEYVFDCHTYIGKRRGKTKADFIVAEQNALNPHHKGEYDDVPWDRYFDFEKNGYYDQNNITASPGKEKVTEVANGCIQLTLF